MLFGVSFAINFDSENIKWTKTKTSISLIRLFLGLCLGLAIELFFLHFYDNLANHTTIYAYHNLFPGMIVTFIIFGLLPSIAEALGLSRTSYI